MTGPPGLPRKMATLLLDHGPGSGRSTRAESADPIQTSAPPTMSGSNEVFENQQVTSKRIPTPSTLNQIRHKFVLNTQRGLQSLNSLAIMRRKDSPGYLSSYPTSVW